MLVALGHPQLVAFGLLGAGCAPLHSREEVLKNKVCPERWAEDAGGGGDTAVDTYMYVAYSYLLSLYHPFNHQVACTHSPHDSVLGPRTYQVWPALAQPSTRTAAEAEQ